MPTVTMPTAQPFELLVDDVVIHGDLVVPPHALGLVIFAHGSGSSRLSLRNRAVARTLNEARFGTLLLDLLSEHEEDIDDITRWYRFEVGMLAGRLIAAAEALQRFASVQDLPLGCFGASTGAGAALVAAADRPELIRAVVCRGGRPDLAGPALPKVQAPTLLIVGGADREVLSINQDALRRLTCSTSLEIIAGATHLFPEPGTLEQVARLAQRWFEQHLAQPMRVPAAP